MGKRDFLGEYGKMSPLRRFIETADIRLLSIIPIFLGLASMPAVGYLLQITLGAILSSEAILSVAGSVMAGIFSLSGFVQIYRREAPAGPSSVHGIPAVISGVLLAAFAIIFGVIGLILFYSELTESLPGI